MVEITLNGLNKRQKVLADILWSFEEWTDVETQTRTSRSPGHRGNDAYGNS
jgi:hypothetical protein